MIALRPTLGFAFSHPAHAIAFGFGAGLSPFAPGTAGSALGWAIGWALGALHPAAFFSVVVVFFLAGVWACEMSGRALGVADHGGMVWDEGVAVLLVVAGVPRELAGGAAACVVCGCGELA